MKESAVTTETLLEIMNNQLETIDKQAKEIADLQQKLDYMLRQKFASSSERFPSNQPSLFQDEASLLPAEEDIEVETITITRKKRGSRTSPPESLSHVRVEHDMSEEEKVCSCGCCHRFLVAASNMKAQHLEGIVEADETFFLDSHKGNHHLERPARKRGGKASQRGLSSEQIPVIIVRDREGHTTDAVLNHANTKEITKIISPLIDKDVLLCSDGNRIYSAFAKALHITHKIINASAGEHIKEGAYHIQNVNAYDSRLRVSHSISKNGIKNWMRHFNGVATKYLESYLGWMRMLDGETGLTPQRVLAISASRINFTHT